MIRVKTELNAMYLNKADQYTQNFPHPLLIIIVYV